ncbi:MAG: response regulator [Balneolaceae bacterium]|nr:response regulator [Balneolaceae bacterium]MCH8548227.1 response regulator [Balneolaceae bacterium]
MAMNILVVDDSAVMRSMIIKTIKLSGLEIGKIHEAGNGEEGLQTLSDNWVDLLFIDVNMPIMDGMEMLDRVRGKQETRDLPILIVSTESNEQRIRTIDEKRAGFVHKPFTPEMLREKIEEVLGLVDKT